MPNHCRNRLVVSGPKSEVDRFIEHAKGYGANWDGRSEEDQAEQDPLDLNKFVPIPESVLNAKKDANSDAYNSGGYEWCCKNWGTKWGCYDVGVVRANEGKAEYEYSTAWAPFNEQVFGAMTAMFPKLKIELDFAEQGCAFYGHASAANGAMKEFWSKAAARKPRGKWGELWEQSG